MARRIEVELTSDRGNGTWTWRAAGARLPKGELEATLLYEGAKVGDVVRAEADFDIDGITILTIFPPKGAKAMPETLEIIGSGRDEGPLVTSQLAGRKSSRDSGRSGRGDKVGRRPRGSKPEGASEDRPRRQTPRPQRPAPLPVRPKAKRLRPGRAHRQALVSSLPSEQKPIAEQILLGGLAAVRSAIDEQNTKASKEGLPTVPVDAILTIAEALVPRLQVADWLDRAEAAMADIEEIALGDLRSVVTSAEVVRGDSTRELANKLREALDRRSQQESENWLNDLTQSVEAGRVVRALRLTSRSPDASVVISPEISQALISAVNAAMAPDTLVDRWLMLVDALAFSTVRSEVQPVGAPSEPSEELLVAVRKHASRMPGVASAFGIEVPNKKKNSVRSKKPTAKPLVPHRDTVRGPSVVVGGRRIPPPPPPRRSEDEKVTTDVATTDEVSTNGEDDH